MHRLEDPYPFWRPEFPRCRPPDLEQLTTRTATARQWAWRIPSITEIYNYAKLCFGCVLKCSLSAHLMQVKATFRHYYLNGGLHAVYIGKPSERMLNFCTVRCLKTECRFPHIPTGEGSSDGSDSSPWLRAWQWLCPPIDPIDDVFWVVIIWSFWCIRGTCSVLCLVVGTSIPVKLISSRLVSKITSYLSCMMLNFANSFRAVIQPNCTK